MKAIQQAGQKPLALTFFECLIATAYCAVLFIPFYWGVTPYCPPEVTSIILILYFFCADKLADITIDLASAISGQTFQDNGQQGKASHNQKSSPKYHT